MKRCLIVDDSNVIRKVARLILESQNFEIAEAEDGKEALDKCTEKTPDVILLDWHMHGMGATEFLTAIRLEHAKRRPYIIYCTTENDADDLARAYAAGADDYILKPFDRAALVSKFSQIPLAA